MQLVELVVQGLKGSPDLKRVVFGPGVTLAPVADDRDRELVRIILELLYPKGQEPALTDLNDGSGNSRVALTVAGRDGARWRLLMDLASGRRALQKIGGEKPETVSTSPAEIGQVVTAQLGCPQEDIARELLFSSRADMPSRRARAAGSKNSTTGAPVKAEKPLPPGFGGAPAPDANADKPLPPGFGDSPGVTAVNPMLARKSPDELRNRLAELDALLSAHQGVKDLEFELDGLQKKAFELEGKLKPLLTLRRSAEQAVAQLQRFSSLDALPGDLVEKGERLKRIRADHERDVQRLEDEKAELVASLGPSGDALRTSAFEIAQKDPLVLYGVGGGALAIVVGFLGAMMDEPTLRWLALLDIPAFGVAVYGAIRVLGSLEDREIVKRRVKRSDDERKKLNDRFRIDEEQIEGLLQKHGFKLEQLPDLQAQMIARDEARQLLDQVRGSLQEAEAGGNVRELERQQHDVQERIRALDERLQAASAGGGSQGDIHAERDEILAFLEGPREPKQQPVVVAAEPVMERPEPTNPGSAPPEDLARRLLEVGRDVYMNTVEDMAALVMPRAAQIAVALTDGRYKELRFVGRGDCFAVDAATDEALPFVSLPGSDRDLLYLATKIATIEAVLKQARLPVVFDRALDGFPDAKADLLKRMLAFLAQQTQVVCLTEKAALQ